MAELKLSTIWEIKDFARKANSNQGEHAELAGLCHASLDRMRWKADLTFVRESETCRDGANVVFNLWASFVPKEVAAKYLWRYLNATLLDANGVAMITYKADRFSDLATLHVWSGYIDEAFDSAAFSKAVSENGSLAIRIDLTILNLVEVLECRELVRGLLTDETDADFLVDVQGERFKLHKCILSGTSTVFARMLRSGLEEAVDGVLTLRDTTAPAFKAFVQAIYFDSWDAISDDVDLAQDVLFLAEKYNVANLKRFCDDSLAVKVTGVNALEILTKCAALCDAEKTKAACTEILAENMDFKDSDMWLDFKKRNRGVALEILDVIGDKWIAACKRLKREKDDLNAANAKLKRKCEEQEKAISSLASKWRRK